MVARESPTLVGRTRERRTLDRSLDDVRHGESAVLVIRGEAGIGKTALIHYCARRATDCRVLQIAGVELELEMPFAALHQLCTPILGDVAALPDPQQRALRVAVGLADGDPPDRFVVGLALLGLLAEGPSNARWCVSSMTRSGSTRRRARCWDSWAGACKRSRLRSSSR